MRPIRLSLLAFGPFATTEVVDFALRWNRVVRDLWSDRGGKVDAVFGDVLCAFRGADQD